MTDRTYNEFGDEVGKEIDSRKLEKLIRSGDIDVGDLNNAEIISSSSCCDADLIGEDFGDDVLISCSKCGSPQSPERGLL